MFMKTFKEFCQLKEADEKISPEVVDAVGNTPLHNQKLGAMTSNDAQKIIKKSPAIKKLGPEGIADAAKMLTGNKQEGV